MKIDVIAPHAHKQKQKQSIEWPNVRLCNSVRPNHQFVPFGRNLTVSSCNLYRRRKKWVDEIIQFALKNLSSVKMLKCYEYWVVEWSCNRSTSKTYQWNIVWIFGLYTGTHVVRRTICDFELELFFWCPAGKRACICDHGVTILIFFQIFAAIFIKLRFFCKLWTKLLAQVHFISGQFDCFYAKKLLFILQISSEAYVPREKVFIYRFGNDPYFIVFFY